MVRDGLLKKEFQRAPGLSQDKEGMAILIVGVIKSLAKNSSHRCISSQEAYSFILFLQWTPIDYLWPRNKGEESEKGFLRDGGGDTKVVFDKFDSKFWSSRFTLAPWQRWFWNYWAVDVERLPELETLLPELGSLWGLCHSVLLWCPVPLLYKGWFIEH